jgi:hypothetical protein
MSKQPDSDMPLASLTIFSSLVSTTMLSCRRVSIGSARIRWLPQLMPLAAPARNVRLNSRAVSKPFSDFQDTCAHPG